MNHFKLVQKTKQTLLLNKPIEIRNPHYEHDASYPCPTILCFTLAFNEKKNVETPCYQLIISY